MELLACEKCHAIVAPYERSDTIQPLPHKNYAILGRHCPSCGHSYFVRRWSHEYVLKENHENHDRQHS